jgi:aspartate kinase
MTGSQCGIITNDAPGGARIVEVRPFRVQDALDAGQIVIVAGFQGVSWKKEVTTLGRGGSDTTAVALAAALSAEACEIYSDVDGVYSADPRKVADARRLDALGHDEMLAMARAGAKVLGADAVAWARLHDVALYARATDGRPGETIVRLNPPADRPWIAAATLRPQCVLLSWSGDVADLATTLQASAVPPIFSLQVPHQTLLLVGRDVADAVDSQFGRLIDRLRDLPDAHGQGPTLYAGTLVSIVGPGVGRECDLLTPFRAALGAQLTAQTPVIAHGLTLSCLLPPEEADAAVAALHAAFLGGVA